MRIIATLFVFISAASLTILGTDSATNVRHPVILVPGDGGSQIEAKLNKTSVVHYLCQKTSSDFFSLWLNLELLVPLVIDCFVDNMRLEYDNVTRLTRNSPGVETRVPGFGNSSTVEWLDPSEASPGAYFHNIAEMFVTKLGYRHEQQALFSSMRELIENTTRANGRPAVLLTHSMGGPLTLTFLRQQSQRWKDKNVRALVTLAAPWGGARTNPSLSWLLPSPLFWKQNETLVFTPTRNFTMAELPEFFDAISWPVGWEMRKDVEKYVMDHSAPGVELHCLHGYGVRTIDALSYTKNSFPDGYPGFVMGDGDGTVNKRSLEGCLYWSPKFRNRRNMNSGYPVYHQVFPNLDHMDSLRHGQIVEYLRQLFSQKINI
ncbi:hypothetical protein B566_EDAN000754 [Ephemera danica]|nr:hypothetical protein B566_EDAN000754 [Ephemera danica]